MKKSLLSAYLLALLLVGCSKENIDHPPVAAIRVTIDAGKFIFDASASTDPDGNALHYRWSSGSPYLSITSATAEKASSAVPLVSSSAQATITLEVNDGQLTSTTTQTVSIPASSQTIAYGLGQDLTVSISNNVDYEWYLDQVDTGPYATENCGPTSVTMAILWANAGFAKTPEDARNTYRPNGGWWYTNDIINYLNGYVVSNYTIQLSAIDVLKNKIDEGDIVILCLDMFYVPHENNESYHVSKFYYTQAQGAGHFIVIKGYEIVDGQTFFEVYDPNSWGNRYGDSEALKGKDRYYKSASLDAATNNWWDYAIVVTKPAAENARVTHPDAIDPASIRHQSGR